MSILNCGHSDFHKKMEAYMIEPMDTLDEQQKAWVHSDQREASLFPDSGDEAEFSDLIFEMNSKLENLADLCQRLSFSMKELSQVLKVR